MGAGCFYHHHNTGTAAYWIEIDRDEYGDAADDTRENIGSILEAAGYVYKGRSRYAGNADYWNGLFSVFLEPTYYSDGIVIRIEPRYDGDQYDARLFNLAIANHHRAENKIAKALNRYYPLQYATSGYTYATIKLNQLNA